MRKTLFGLLFVAVLSPAAHAHDEAFSLGGTDSRSSDSPTELSRSGPIIPGVPGAQTVRARVEAHSKALAFEANQGQTDAHVQFVSRSSRYRLFLTSDAAILALNGPSESETAPRLPRAHPSSVSEADRAPDARSLLLRMRLVGSNPGVKLDGVEELPGKAHYFLGNDPATWRTNVPTYRKVRYPGIYPGVDLVYYGNQGELEYDFVIAPGADPATIAIQFEGAPVTIDARGNLVLSDGGRDVVFRKPVIYQDKDGSRTAVDGRYVLTAPNRVGFAVASYDHGRPLVIDPTLAYSTLLGGSFDDAGFAIAVDGSGNVYVAGYTCSADFPFTESAYQTSHSDGAGGPCGPNIQGTGRWDAFVTKIDPTGSTAVYSTYLGGSSTDFASGIAVDGSGNAYVVGGTQSSNFPVTAAAFQPVCAPHIVYDGACQPTVQTGCVANSGLWSGFVTKLDPTGSDLIYSTFIGGTGNDQLRAVAVNSTGEAYVTGFASSKPAATLSCGGPPYRPVNSVYPTTGGAYQSIPQTQYDNNTNETFYVVFSKLTADGSGLAYSTDLFGQGTQQSTFNFAQAIAIDTAGNAYITGLAFDPNFPVTTGAFQTGCGSCPTWPDAFVAKFDPSQSGAASLVYSTFLGGDGDDAGYGIAVDSSGNAYVAGATGGPSGGPTSTNFPTTTGAYQANCPRDRCTGGTSFVAKLNPAGSGVAYSTYLGGTTATRQDQAYAIAVDPGGQAYVTGSTSDSTFPVKNSIQGYVGAGGFSDLFVTVLNAAGSDLIFSTPLGGSNPDAGQGIVLDGKGGVYVTGATSSTNGIAPFFPTTTGAFQTGCGDLTLCTGYSDALVVKIDMAPPDTTPPTVSFGAPSPAPNANGWNNTGVSIPFTILDTGSGVDSGASTSSPLTLSADGAAVTGSVTATDKAGNSTLVSSPAVKIDTTPPSVNITTPTGGAAFAFGQSVAASYSCADALSGVDTCAGPVTSGSNIDTASPGSKTFTVTATDRAGNVNTQSVTYSVTPPPVEVSVTPPSVVGGTNATGKITLVAPAPPGGIVVTLASSAAAATVPTSLTFPAGSSSKTFTIKTVPVGVSTPVTISASYGGATVTAPLTVSAPVPSRVTLSPASVTGGVSSKGSVTLTGKAPAGGLSVQLASSTGAASVGLDVTVPAGALSATFPVTTASVMAATPTDISASYAGTTVKGTLTVLPAALSKVTLAATSVGGGNALNTNTVTLTGIAPAGGAQVTLSSNHGAATVPSSVTVPAGLTSATFTITTTPVTASILVTIKASYQGVTKATNLTVKAPTVNTLSLNPSVVPGGSPSTGTVTLTGSAPAGGTVVALKSSSAAVATVPPSLTVSPGSATADFTVTTAHVGKATSPTISASAGGVSKAAILSVTP